MNPSDIREMLDEWIGSRVQVVTYGGITHYGRLAALSCALELESGAIIPYRDIAEVWVPRIGGN